MVWWEIIETINALYYLRIVICGGHSTCWSPSCCWSANVAAYSDQVASYSARILDEFACSCRRPRPRQLRHGCSPHLCWSLTCQFGFVAGYFGMPYCSSGWSSRPAARNCDLCHRRFRGFRDYCCLCPVCYVSPPFSDALGFLLFCACDVFVFRGTSFGRHRCPWSRLSSTLCIFCLSSLVSCISWSNSGLASVTIHRLYRCRRFLWRLPCCWQIGPLDLHFPIRSRTCR